MLHSIKDIKPTGGNEDTFHRGCPGKGDKSVSESVFPLFQRRFQKGEIFPDRANEMLTLLASILYTNSASAVTKNTLANFLIAIPLSHRIGEEANSL